MRKRLHKTIITALLAGTAALSCLPNPEAPVLDPPGTVLLFDANFNNIQMNGDFSGISWDPADTRNDLTLVDDHLWAITVSLLDSDLSDGNLEFKFSTEYDWAPESFGAGGSLGQAELASGTNNIVLPVSLTRGFYTFTFDDETFQYSTEPEAAAGTLDGTLNFDGDTPAGGAELTLVVEREGGNATLWSLEQLDGAFAFEGLADSLYTLRASAAGYASQTLGGIQVAAGAAPDQTIVLSQVFGAISGTVSFEGFEAAPFPEAIVIAMEQGTQIEAGRDTSDVATGEYRVDGLGSATFDLSFSAPDFLDGGIEGIVIAGDMEATGQDITLLEQPWFIPVIDGAIDEGWPSSVDDGGHASNWGGSNNLNALHISWDDERLYVGIDGVAEGGNAINAYIDVDYGSGTGVTAFQTIGGLGPIGDSQLRTNINTGLTPEYGAEIGVTVRGDGSNAGVCDLADPGNIALIADTELVKGTGAVEFSIPWSAIAPEGGGTLPEGADLAIFCLISSGDSPEWFADDFLPALGVDLPTNPQTDYPVPAGKVHVIHVTGE